MKKYEQAGVSISRGDELVKRIKSKAKSTFNSDVLSEIGHFGGFYNASFPEYEEPVLISSVDGVGTKIKVAIAMDKHDTIGQCLVNHCVNDILCAGAKPLFFLDYLAFGRLNVEIAEKIIEGFAIACRENGCALIGGETAEMPDLYEKNDYDISGTIIGVVEKSKIIDGKRIKKGDVLLALKSSGLHTNGYSLARKVLLSKYEYYSFIQKLEARIGDELLNIHRSYLKLVYPLLSKFDIKGISHITGGGIIGNTKRILPEGHKIVIDWNSWEIPEIFRLIQSTGEISDEEMREVFNLGIGMILVVSENEVEGIKNELLNKNEETLIIGRIE